jgi:peptidoglycan/LPS O-acetylase OafA/YrhL
MDTLQKRIPSLDGLRALSILLVILSHCFLHFQARGRVQTWFLALVSNGSVGVSIFFVISGFLITLLLVKEEKRFGSIDLKDFYVRRAFRILPAFLLYVGTVGVLTLTGVLTIPAREFWHALTFTMDYLQNRDWYLGHVWSLSVEEQFYLLWPAMMVFLSKRSLKRIAAAVVILGPLIRMLDRALLPNTRFEIEYMGHTRADMLMFGCLIALYFGDERLAALLKRLSAFGVPALSALFLFVISPAIELRFGGMYIKTIGYTLQGLSISIVMLYLITNFERGPGKLCNAPIVVHLGTLSYSLYLWQELFLGSNRFDPLRILAGVGCAVLAAEASYFLVEQPMLRVKRGFEHGRLAASKPGELPTPTYVADAEVLPQRR